MNNRLPLKRFCKTKKRESGLGAPSSWLEGIDTAEFLSSRCDGSTTPWALEGRSSLRGFRETEMASNGSDEGSQAGAKSGPGRLGNGRIVGFVGAVLQAGPLRGGRSTSGYLYADVSHLAFRALVSTSVPFVCTSDDVSYEAPPKVVVDVSGYPVAYLRFRRGGRTKEGVAEPCR
ncbi:hypothetical protein QLX08_000803 [Tetragonisca angustula]|uniref:Uncharacterized protein n=1 Tax=Tetragonisca angustula TaxID=166442 RepID=A0AAW1AI20_9HYME